MGSRMIPLLTFFALTFKATPSADQFCYPPDEHQIGMCYWPNGMVCAQSYPPWQDAWECVGRGAFTDGMTEEELKEHLIVDVLSRPGAL